MLTECVLGYSVLSVYVRLCVRTAREVSQVNEVVVVEEAVLAGVHAPTRHAESQHILACGLRRGVIAPRDAACTCN